MMNQISKYRAERLCIRYRKTQNKILKTQMMESPKNAELKKLQK